ncbi:MAG TPA: hypothetical protein VGA08_04230, partial [Candidatus Saccharimonadales bacterium]
EDLSGTLELIIFPKVYEKHRPQILPDAVVFAVGRVSSKDRAGNLSGDPKVLADELKFVDEDVIKNYQPTNKPKSRPPQRPLAAKAKLESKLYVHIKDPNNHSQLKDLKQALDRHPGSTEAILVLGDETKSALRLPFRVDVSNGLTDELRRMIPREAVVVK